MSNAIAGSGWRGTATYSMNMVTTRGCPYHCNWCAKPIWGQRYNSRSPENVVAEMKWLKETYRPDHLWFADDIFGLKPGWIERFGELARAQSAVIPFKCLSRADLIKPAVVAGLQTAGCRTVWMGAESGSQRILDAMEKGTTVEHIAAARRLLGDAGIAVGFFCSSVIPAKRAPTLRPRWSWCAPPSPTISAFRCRIRCPARHSSIASRHNLARRKTGAAALIWLCSITAHSPRGFTGSVHTVVHREFRLRKGWNELKRTRQPRLLAATIYRALTLPAARWRLNRLARVSHPAAPTLPVVLSQQEAAQPSAQSQS